MNANVSWMALAVVAALPSVMACSLSEEPPQPARFATWNPDTDERHTVDLRGRQLSAECALSNQFAYDGQSFAWIEGDSGYAFQTLHLRDLDTGKSWTKRLPESLNPDVTLAAGRVYVTWVRDSQDGWHAASMDTRLEDWQEVPLPGWTNEGQGEWGANDGVLVWVNGGWGDQSFGIYDPVAKSVLTEGSVTNWDGNSHSSWVKPEHFGRVLALGSGEDGVFVLDYATRSRTIIEPRTEHRLPTPLGVSGYDVLGSTYDNQHQEFNALWRRNMVADGSPMFLDIRDRVNGFSLLGLRGSHFILGTYSTEGLPAEWGGPGAESKDAPAPNWLVAMWILAVAAHWRRR